MYAPFAGLAVRMHPWSWRLATRHTTCAFSCAARAGSALLPLVQAPEQRLPLVFDYVARKQEGVYRLPCLVGFQPCGVKDATGLTTRPYPTYLLSPPSHARRPLPCFLPPSPQPKTFLSGGAVRVYGGYFQAVVSIADSLFEGNFAEWGGGLWINSGYSLTVTGTVFRDNGVARFGGAASVESGGVAEFTACNFTANFAHNGGGGEMAQQYGAVRYGTVRHGTVWRVQVEWG